MARRATSSPFRIRVRITDDSTPTTSTILAVGLQTRRISRRAAVMSRQYCTAMRNRLRRCL